MKKNSIYIIWIIFLIILIILGIYNYSHPIKSDESVISSGKVIGVNQNLEYDENSEYVESYSIEVETKKNGNITIELSRDELAKYKKDDKVNFYEEKGEYFITEEKANDSNTNIKWLILPIIEFLAVIFLIVKMIKK